MVNASKSVMGTKVPSVHYSYKNKAGPQAIFSPKNGLTPKPGPKDNKIFGERVVYNSRGEIAQSKGVMGPVVCKKV